ncbi:nuclear factor NF-kappa-B p105 subunit-like [Uloborus diversus]|uniref:nuclear factor NF-kappa-B p105 subunit-like n=1 Tax=Uloborus diversus TaxID=327109 RepID=UPI0024099341|nr:nuclear factor NF-kappa-B p105 subunit-like [Uloborus diversus]
MPFIHRVNASSSSPSSIQINESSAVMNLNNQGISGEPQLVFVIKPVSKMRFRYQTEKGSHGVLTGYTDPSVKRQKKVYPVVQLKNYVGRKAVYLQISLYTLDEKMPHVLYLFGKDCDENGICRVKFSKDLTASFQVSIGSRKKEDVLEILRQKKKQEYGNDFEPKLAEIEEEAKKINQNAAKLCLEAFVASDPNRPICHAFSDAIYNSKSTETGDLKICRLSRIAGSCSGGDEIFLFCDKVKKENVKVHFYEEKDGEIIWEDYGIFTKADWHHQVALAFKTPPYEGNKEAKVWIELLRTTDDVRSEPREYHYIPNEPDLVWKKRKLEPHPHDDLSHFNVIKPCPSEYLMNNPPSFPTSSISENPPILRNDVNFNSGISNERSFNEIFQNSDEEPSLSPLLDSGDLSFDFLEPYVSPMDYTDFMPHAKVLTDAVTETYAEEQITPDARAFKHTERGIIEGQMGESKDALAMKLSSLGLRSKSSLYQNETKLQKIEMPPESKKLNFEEAVRDAFSNGSIETLLRFSFQLIPWQNRNGDSLLHLAVIHQGDNINFISKLLELVPGYDYNHQNKRKKTPLHIATEMNKQLLIKLLLEHGASPTVQDSVGDTCIHIACKKKSDKILKELLTKIKGPAELSMSNYEGLTPVHISVIRGAEQCLQHLTNFKADLNAIDKKSGRTPLHFAIEAPLPILKFLLLQPSIDKTAEDFSGRTILNYAEESGSKEHKLLIEEALFSSCEDSNEFNSILLKSVHLCLKLGVLENGCKLRVE